MLAPPADILAMQALLDSLATLHRPDYACRVFHGRGGTLPGCEAWTLDWFDPVWLFTSFLPVDDADMARLLAALAARWQQIGAGQPLNVLWQTRLDGRSQARVDGRSQTRLMAGAVPDPQTVTEDGCRYRVHLASGQNHGLFLDMAEGRRWVRQQAAARPGMKVLNLFAYTCAFSVVALQAGAGTVINLDMSASALAIGQHNHRLNGIGSGASFWPHDLFNSWGKVGRAAPFDLVIVDPPSYQKGSFVAGKDYPRLLRRLPDLLAPGGQVLLCLNAPEIGPAFLHQAMQAQAPGLAFVLRLPNPPAFADVSPDRALKVLVWQAPAA